MGNSGRSTTRPRSAGGASSDRRQLLGASGLLFGVLAILLLGAILQTDSDEPGRARSLASPTPAPVAAPWDASEHTEDDRLVLERADRPAAEAPAPEPAPQPQREPAQTAGRRETARAATPDEDAAPAHGAGGGTLEDLGRRALADQARLAAAASGDDWTLQLLVACEPSNARRLLDRARGTDELLLLPLTLNGRSCFRLCWGRYASREAAVDADDLPSAVRATLEEAPRPRAVGDLLR